MPNPNPRLPPVTMTLRIAANQLSGFGDGQRRYEVDRNWNLVRLKGVTAEQQDFVLKFAHVVLDRRRICFEHYLGYHQSPCDGILLRVDERQVHRRVTVDDRFHLFGVYLQTANIDDAVTPTDKVIAAVSQFQQVAGIYPIVRVLENR